jgi:hypothetical protein
MDQGFAAARERRGEHLNAGPMIGLRGIANSIGCAGLKGKEIDIVKSAHDRINSKLPQAFGLRNFATQASYPVPILKEPPRNCAPNISSRAGDKNFHAQSE